MCDPITLITTAATTAIGITQQLQKAESERNSHNWLAAQQRNAAAVDGQRALQAEQQGEADADAARARAAQRAGSAQARLAAQGSDLLGSPVDVLGDLEAIGEQDALSLRYRAMQDAWGHRVRGAGREAEARRHEADARNVDPTLGIASSLIR